MNRVIEEISHMCSSEYYEIGFASLSGLMKSDYSKYQYGLSLARKLDDSIIDEIVEGPTSLYYNLYRQINNELNQKTDEISKLLKTYDIDSYPIEATVDESKLDGNYEKTLRYHFSHKMVATQAGLGWIGKTDLLITSRFGPRVRLASILTSSRISEIGEPINASKCGKCNICVEKCPARAATGKLWSTAIDRDAFYNAFKCRRYCRQVSGEKLNKSISLCGICISVCPKGVR